MTSPSLHHTVSGPAGAPPVLFLHGFMGRGADWEEIIHPLDHEFLCICIDLPGHGRSLGFGDADAYSFEGACRGVQKVLQELGCERPACVAYSMGGRVALALAVRMPDLFQRLLIESSCPGLETADAREARALVDDERALRLERGRFERFLSAWYANPLFGSLAAKPGLRSQLIEDRLRNDPAELARALRGMSTGRQPSFWNELPAVPVPVLVMAGVLDARYADDAPRMADLFPEGRARIVPDAGHTIHREQPKLFLETVREFLAPTGEPTRGND